MAKRPEKNDDVRLYYLGGITRKHGGGEDAPTPVRSRGRVYMLPPIGSYLEVAPSVARDLINRHRVETKEGTFDAFTFDRRLAERVVARKLTPDLAQAPDFSRDQLLRMLAEKDPDMAEALAILTDDEPPLPVPTDVSVKDEPPLPNLADNPEKSGVQINPTLGTLQDKKGK